MNLTSLISTEFNADPKHIMLLRHSNRSVALLEREGASIEEYTLVQPTNSRYDYFADGHLPVEYVVVIVRGHVHSVYYVEGVAEQGTTYSLVSPAHQRFDRKQGFAPLPAKRFQAKPLNSRAIGRPVSGWSNPRVAVARFGGRLFDSVEV